MSGHPRLRSALVCVVIAFASVISSPAPACDRGDSEQSRRALEEYKRERAEAEEYGKKIAAQQQAVAAAEQRTREAQAAKPARPKQVAAEEKRLADARARLRQMEEAARWSQGKLRPLC